MNKSDTADRMVTATPKVNRRKWNRYYSTSNTRIAANMAKNLNNGEREVRVRYDDAIQLCVVEWRLK